MNQLRHCNGRFARSPVTPEQFRTRVEQLAGGLVMQSLDEGGGYRTRSVSEAQRMAAMELRLSLICNDITGEVLDWTEMGA